MSAEPKSEHPRGEEVEEPNTSSLGSNVEDEATKRGPGDGGAIKKTQSKASANDVASVPNGGLQAWLQVAGGFCLYFNTWGVLNTFGVYQAYYEEVRLASSSDISWIGSLQSFLLLVVGAATGPIYDAGYLRSLIVTGTFLVVFGHMMLSLIHEYYQAVLAQAVVIGIGAGLLFVPSVAVISTYFTTRISTAMGLAASGSSLGGIIYPIMFYKLVPQVGFGWAVRIIGFMALGLLAIPCVVLKMRVKPPAKRKLIDLSAFKELPYTSFCIAGFTGFMGLYVVFFYISYYGFAAHIASADLSFYFLPMLNAGSVFGRIIPNIIADKIGVLNVLIPAALFSSVLTYCLMAAKDVGGVAAIAVLYGFFSGAFVSLPPSIVVHLTPPNKRSSIGTRMGMSFTVAAFGVLVGAPVAGAILGSKNDFKSTFIFGGTLLMAGAVLFAVTRMIKSKGKLIAKA